MSLRVSGNMGGVFTDFVLRKLYRIDIEASMTNMMAFVRRLKELARECFTRGTNTHTKMKIGIKGIVLLAAAYTSYASSLVDTSKA